MLLAGSHPDDQTIQTTETPGFKPLTTIITCYNEEYNNTNFWQKEMCSIEKPLYSNVFILLIFTLKTAREKLKAVSQKLI